MRIGRLSNINETAKTGQVIYEDLDGAVSNHMPFLQQGETFVFPEIGDMVVVGLLENGGSGIILGKI